MAYKSEEREKFFEKDFPVIQELVPLIASLPDGNICDMLPHHMVDRTVRSLAACMYMATKIIEDDQAEIEALKAIIKGMGK
jgi:hypothetical protein